MGAPLLQEAWLGWGGCCRGLQVAGGAGTSVGVAPWTGGGMAWRTHARTPPSQPRPLPPPPPCADIANDLEEYLAHLNRTAFSFEGGPTLDFAEAALLIQSSACVYSKKVRRHDGTAWPPWCRHWSTEHGDMQRTGKAWHGRSTQRAATHPPPQHAPPQVEYLHNLAYQALETVRCKKRAAEAGSAPEAGGAGAGGGGRGGRGGAHEEEDDSLEAFLAAGEGLQEADGTCLACEEGYEEG